MSPTPEQKARQDIDAALEAAGWVVQDRAAMNQPRELRGVAAIGLDAVAGAAWDHRWGDDAAGQVFLGEVAVQPVAARTGFVDESESVRFRVQFANELVDVAAVGADLPEEHDVCAIIGAVGDGNRLFVNIETNVHRGRIVANLCHD